MKVGKILKASLVTLLMLHPVTINTIKRDQVKSTYISLEDKVSADQPSCDNYYNYFKDTISKTEEHLNRLDKRGGYYIVALSNIAESLANYLNKNPGREEEITHLLEDIVKIAVSNQRVNPYGKPLENIRDLRNFGYYLGHLNLVLGIYKKVSGWDKYLKVNQKISNHLTKSILSDPHYHMGSFPNDKYRWPADQTVILYSLYLFDQNYNEHLSKEPISAWLEYMEGKATDSKTRLPFSEVTGSRYGSYPRGCAISWSVYYISHFAPKNAKELWERYKKEYKKDCLIFSGFREWPLGTNIPADIDSGPIILGIGTAATALSIRASASMGDINTYNSLRNLKKVAELYISLSKDERLKRISEDFLARSILFNSETIINNQENPT